MTKKRAPLFLTILLALAFGQAFAGTLTWVTDDTQGGKYIVGGGASGWAVVDDLKNSEIKIRQITISADVPNLLIHRRLDGFICLETVFDAYLAKNPKSTLTLKRSVLPFGKSPII